MGCKICLKKTSQIENDFCPEEKEIKFLDYKSANDDLLEIIERTYNFFKLITLKEYVENDPKVRQLIQEAGGEAKVKELLTSLHLTGSPVIPVAPPTEPTGIYIPGNDRLVVPMNSQVVLPENIDSTILPIFDCLF